MMNKENLKIVFFGTPEFAVESLSRLVESGFNVSAVVTMPDKEAGRGHKMLQSDVKKYALQKGLKLLQPVKLKSQEFIDELRAIDADLFIVIAFRMLPEVVWSMPRLGTFNLHASLLPKYRGAAPINRAIMNGEKETGITTFFLKQEIDTGDMIEQRMTPISEEDNAGTLHDRLMTMGAEMVESTVNRIIEGNLATQPQPEGEYIGAPKIFKSDCAIEWNQPAVNIHNQVRGLSPYPAAFTTIEDNKGKLMDTKIFLTRLSDKPVEGLTPGDCTTDGKRLWVATGDNMIEILELQPAGKKRMPVASYLLGYHPAKMHKSTVTV
ncbi:MAG: methionyl-tRNA formyltransferase [Muribaculaceae bacterium]|nr:methionyl-tRNA formyltransferase [Muribaculaceae bacterium]